MRLHQLLLLSLVAGLLSAAAAAPAHAAIDPVENGVEEEKSTNGTLSGTITDDTGLGMPGVMLRLDRFNRYTISDLDGSFVFLAVPEGSYTMSATYLGYKDLSVPVTVKGGKDTHIDLHMSENALMMDEVVVFGEMAKGQARALNIEKNNSNITNLVAADQIGRFPDSNIGDALKRIPGITIQTDQGEARNLVVRGLATSLNSVTLDGGRIPSAEGDNRNVQLDLIPSEMIQVIEVNKTLLPDMEADAIGGSVNLKTKPAPERRLINLNLGGGWNPIRQSPTYKAGFTYGDRFLEDKKLGAVLSLSFQDKIYGSDNIEGEWAKGKGDLADYMGEFEVRNYNVMRLRTSVSLNLDYEINPNNSLYFRSMYNYRNDYENLYAFKMKKMEPSEDHPGLFEGELRRTIKMGAVTDLNPSGRRLENQQMMHFDLAGKHLFGQSLHADWGASFARALEKKPHERKPEWRIKGALISADHSDPLYPVYTTDDDVYEDYELKELVDQTSRTHEDEWSAYANFRMPLSVIEDQKGRLRFGAKARFKSKVRDNDSFEAEPLEEGSYDFARMTQPTVTFDRIMGGRYLPGRFPDAKALGEEDWFDPARFEVSDLLEEYWVKNYRARENVYAGYLRWDQNITEDFLLILGARVEHTAIDYTGNTIDYDEEGDPTKGDSNQGTTSYTNIFPNLTLRYEPEENLVLRAAYSTSIARPDYYKLVPYLSINREDGEIDLGNPDLKSTYAHNVDLIGSWYTGRAGSISIGAFYKRLDNFIFDQLIENMPAEQFGRTYPQYADLVREGEWDVLSKRNGSTVDLFGFEIGASQQLSFLPGFLKGFSLYANYSFVKSTARGITNEAGEERTGVPLPGTAPHTINLSIGYENSFLQARLSLNHAAAYLDALGGDAAMDIYYDRQTFLDFNASADLGKGFSIYFEANNLLNTPLRYYQGTTDRLKQQEYYRPTIAAGLKWTL